MTGTAGKTLILGNSKMNLTVARARAFLDLFLPRLSPPADREVVLAAPFTVLPAISESLRGQPVGLAAQNIFWEDEGPYTGEISGQMLSELGVTYVLIGHSERRTHFQEDNRMINRKIRAALRNRLKPVLCVGEPEDVRAAGRAEAMVREQVVHALEDVPPAEAAGMVAAYEPIWAIGTGRAASPADAAEMHACIRAELDRLLGPAGGTIRILYGGSVTPENIDVLMARPEIDGVLVGAASLKAEEFLRIVEYSENSGSLPANR